MKLEKDGFLADLYRWFRAYKEYIATVGYSNNTIALYTTIIDQFIEFSRQYDEEMSIKEINTFYISSFLSFMENRALISSKNKLKGKTISKSTKRAYIKALKSFFAFIGDNNDELFIFDRIFDKIRIKERRSEEKVAYLSEEEIARLLQILEDEKSRFGRYDNYRNSLLIKLMLYGGLRVSEALQVRLEDFELLEKGVYKVKVLGKGGLEQYAFIGADIIKEEIFYFQTRFTSNDPIMVTASNKPLQRQNAFIIAKRLYEKAGIHKQGLHLLRHTFAMRLARRGVDVLVIKKALRHASIQSTMIYARAEDRDVVKIACSKG